MLREIEVLILRFKAKWFPTEDDKSWEQWVTSERRNVVDLMNLLNSDDFEDELRRRALFLLLVPMPELNPYYWENNLGEFQQEPEFLKNLNSDLLCYAVELIADFYSILAPMNGSGSKKTVLRTCCGASTVDVPGKYHQVLCFYNKCILLLLTFLEEVRSTEILYITQMMLDRFSQENKELIIEIKSAIEKGNQRQRSCD